MDYTNILIPVDGSENSHYACRIAADLTNALSGKETLHLLYCAEPIPSLIGGEQREHIKRECETQAEYVFNTAKLVLLETGNDIKTYVRYGETAPTITATAQELGCSMIIMGTKGLNDMESLVLGDVSHDVLHLATVPVLLVNKKRVQSNETQRVP